MRWNSLRWSNSHQTFSGESKEEISGAGGDSRRAGASTRSEGKGGAGQKPWRYHIHLTVRTATSSPDTGKAYRKIRQATPTEDRVSPLFSQDAKPSAANYKKDREQRGHSTSVLSMENFAFHGSFTAWRGSRCDTHPLRHDSQTFARGIHHDHGQLGEPATSHQITGLSLRAVGVHQTRTH